MTTNKTVRLQAKVAPRDADDFLRAAKRRGLTVSQLLRGYVRRVAQAERDEK